MSMAETKSYVTFTSECLVSRDKVVKKYRTFFTDRAQHEISILNKLRSYEGFPHIKDIVTTEDTIEITMNYLGEPIHYQSDPPSPYPSHPHPSHPHLDAPMKKILVDILGLLKILHGENITHCDLKPNNILIDDRSQMVSIIDFSHSIIGNDMRYVAPHSCYHAPELLRKKIIDPRKIDVWSLGCIIYELLTDKILFDIDTEKEFLRMIDRNEHIKLMDLYQLQPADKSLLQKMLEIDPAKRADIDTIISDLLPTVTPT